MAQVIKSMYFQNGTTAAAYENKIYVKPINKYNYETYPLKDLGGALALTLDEYLGLRANYYMFNETLTGLVLYESPITEENETTE